MYKEMFGTKIKKARTDAGYTQQQVADITNIGRANIARYETGSLEPSLETLGVLAQFYDVSVDWLLGVKTSGKIEGEVTWRLKK